MTRRVRYRLFVTALGAFVVSAGCYYDKFSKVGEIDDDGTGGSSSGGSNMGGDDGSGGMGGDVATGGMTNDNFTLPDRLATTTQGTSVVINLMAGLDSDAEFESAADESSGVPENLKGDFSTSSNGVLTFDPHADFWGIYEGTYTVTSPGGKEVTASIRIVVVPKRVDLSLIESGYGGFIIDGSTDDRLGESIASANVDGDDFDDLILGAPGPAAATGRVAILRGGSDLASLDLGTEGDLAQFFVGDGTTNGRNAGAAVSGGDLNDDGIGDIVIGAPGSAAGAHGRVYVRYGASTFSAPGADITLNSNPGAAGFTVVGSSNYARTGRSLALGQLNGATGIDLLVTTFEQTSPGSAGALRGFLSPASSNPPVEQSDLLFAATTLFDAPNSIAAVGDNVGDDGQAEILFSMNGRIVLLIGGATWPADIDAFTPYAAGSGDGWVGSTSQANANKQVAAAGRFDGVDGFDLAHCDGVSQCRIVSWTQPNTFNLDAGWLITGLTGGVPPKVAGGGDINGDGFDDLLFSHPGGAYVIWGRAALPSTSQDVANLDDNGVTIIPTTPDAIGKPALVGDINNDGLIDYAIPVPDYDGGKGRVYVIFGTPATAN